MVKKKSKIGKLFKKMNGTSNLEVKFGEFLKTLNINFIQHFVYKNKEYDFLLIDYNILIETHGCFYHCCKTHHPKPKYPFQRKNIKNDKLKSRNVKFNRDYNLFIVWEHEMKSLDSVKNKLNEFIVRYSKIDV